MKTINFSDICRTCLRGDNLYPIFSKIEEYDRNSYNIYVTTGLKIKHDDGLPQNICAECLSFINESLKARQKFKDIQILLLQQFNKNFDNDNEKFINIINSNDNNSTDKLVIENYDDRQNINANNNTDEKYINRHSNNINESNSDDLDDIPLKYLLGNKNINKHNDNKYHYILEFHDETLENDESQLKDNIIEIIPKKKAVKVEIEYENTKSLIVFKETYNNSKLSDKTCNDNLKMDNSNKDIYVNENNGSLHSNKYNKNKSVNIKPNNINNTLFTKLIDENKANGNIIYDIVNENDCNKKCNTRNDNIINEIDINFNNGIIDNDKIFNQIDNIDDFNNGNAVHDKITIENDINEKLMNENTPNDKIVNENDINEKSNDNIFNEKLNNGNGDNDSISNDETLIKNRNTRVACKFCGKNLSYRSIDAHMSKYHPSDDAKRTKCTLCDDYVLKNKVKKHLELVHGVKRLLCSYCSTEFETKDLLKDHVAICTEGKKKRKAYHSGREQTECDICHKKMQRASLRLHKEVKHKGMGPVCEHCGRKFGNKFRLNEHLRAKHGYEKYKCSMCEFTSATNIALQNHERRHRGEKPFACECGAKFHAAYLLAQHKQSHRTERVLKCSECPSSFKSSNSLHMHRAMCHSARRAACALCARAFASRHYAARHLRAVHRLQGPIDNTLIAI